MTVSGQVDKLIQGPPRGSISHSLLTAIEQRNGDYQFKSTTRPGSPNYQWYVCHDATTTNCNCINLQKVLSRRIRIQVFILDFLSSTPPYSYSSTVTSHSLTPNEKFTWQPSSPWCKPGRPDLVAIAWRAGSGIGQSRRSPSNVSSVQVV